MAPRLIIFARAPIVGTVKSRIACAVGPEQACAIYQMILETLFNHLRDVTEVELRVTPDSAINGFSTRPNPSWKLRPQGDGDLGERLQRAFDEGFKTSSDWILIIGSDCPEVTSLDISEAAKALETCDLVLGPALDGGYWLIGLREPHSDLFHKIQWSSDQVLRQTIERAREANLRIHFLRELSDIDTIEDWNRYVARHAIIL